jgi:hypothetical protein
MAIWTAVKSARVVAIAGRVWRKGTPTAKAKAA